MITIIFGAGASYGSDNTGTPPLGNALFNELKSFAPSTWGMVSGTIANTFKADFERGMVDLIQRSQFAVPLQWDMAEYFYKGFPISQGNYYIRLLNALKKLSGKIVLSTLNYDTLLFQAAMNVGFSVNIGSGRPSNNGFSLTLPHGSSVLYCESVKAIGNIRFTGNISSSGSIKIFNNLTEFIREKQSNRFPPVMSYYEPNKFTPSGSDFISNQRSEFNQHISTADKIVIIGMRVHVIDKHIWGPLENTKGEILYIGGRQGKTEFDQWSKKSNRTNDMAVPKYFMDSITDIESFLNV